MQRRRSIRKRRSWGDRLGDAWQWVPIVQVRWPSLGEQAVIAVLAYEALGGGYLWWTRPLPVQAEPETAALVVTSTPSGADVMLDETNLGATPLTVGAVDVGTHILVLRYPEARTVRQTIDVLADQDNSVDVALERDQAAPILLRTPLPGTELADVGFLADGRLALRVQVAEQAFQAWTRDTDGTPHHLADAGGPTAISPDGSAVAALTTDGLLLGDRVLWHQEHEQPVDLFWQPDAQGLIAVTHTQSTSGYDQTEIRRASLDGTTEQLLTMPAAWVPGSEVWAGNGQAFAWISHTPNLAALCSLGLSGEDSFRFVQDLDVGYKTGPGVATDPWQPDQRITRAKDGQLSIGALPLGIAADELTYAARFDPAHTQALVVTNAVVGSGGHHDHRLVQLGWWQP